jgi:GT2 family glycosyltransferase
MHNNLISFLIVNWEGKEVVKECIRSIEFTFKHFQTSNPDWNYEIVIIDNASKNLEKDWFLQQHNLKLLINDTNLKFAKGTNQSVKHSNGKYIFILNNDIILFEDCLREIFEPHRSQTNIVTVPRFYYPDGRPQKSIRGLPRLKDYFYILTGLNKLHPKYDHWYQNHFNYENASYVEQPLFSALFLKRETWDVVGDMDENFPIFFNDVDWFARAKKSNIRTLYVPKAQVYHYFGHSVNKNRIKKVWVSTLALRRYFYKNHPMNFIKKILFEFFCMGSFILRVVKESITIITGYIKNRNK